VTRQELLLAAARAGDPGAFTRLVEPMQRDLHAYCYRLLGSVHDAEDAMQETLVRAWQALDRFEDRGSIRPWLYRIATNRCLTLIERRGRRELPTDLGPGSPPAAETTWLEPYPGPETDVLAREGMELAFVAALQRLTAQQRAVLVLRRLVGFSARETAELLGTTITSVNSAQQRASSAIGEIPAPAAAEDPSVRALAERYAAAWEAGDVDAIVALLADDVRYSMPPEPVWYEGRARVRAFIDDVLAAGAWRFLPTLANSSPAFGTYLWEEERGAFVPIALDVLAVRGGKVTEVVSFLTVRDFTPFGLPNELPR
jgi:RNA polymerase sigma-70 factor (TIGR02960 family)